MNNFYKANKLLDLDYVANSFPTEWGYFQQIPAELNLHFEVEGQRISLQNPFGGPIYIDIHKKLKYHQTFFYKNSVYKQPLARALGIKKEIQKECKAPKVLDASAGLLGDTLLIHAFGADVTAMERNPLVSLLIANALNNSELEIPFFFQSAMDLAIHHPVIFFDPMYGEKNTKASPKKEMQVFRNLVGVDEDRLEVAMHLRALCDRLVIKRSIKAMPLIERPSMTFSGKSTCYDVYLNQSK